MLCRKIPSMIEDFDDHARYKALVAVKWQGEHLQVICTAYFREEDGEAVFMIGRHLLPPGEPFARGAHAVDYICPPESMKLVSGEEYRYLGTILVDLDATQHWPLTDPIELPSLDSSAEPH
jgi:hypothetical protein